MICEQCKKEHDGTFGSGRFCSRSCSCKWVALHQSDESKQRKVLAGSGNLTYNHNKDKNGSNSKSFTNSLNRKREQILGFIQENSFEHELWKEFVCSETSRVQHLWFVSNMGRICKDGKISLGCLKSDGYRRLGNMKGIHNIVAENFIPKTDEDIELNRTFIDHINGIRDDNRAENLRWCTISENNSFELSRNHQSKSKQVNNPMSGKKPNNFGKIIYNDGKVSKFFYEGKQPNGFVIGRLNNLFK